MSDSDRVEIELLLNSGLFDPDWYAATYLDVARSGLGAAEHFVRIGRRIGRRGSEGAKKVPISGVSTGTVESDFSIPRIELPHMASRAPLPNLDTELRAAIAKSRLFDEGWYLDHYGQLVTNHDDLLLDYLSSFVADPGRDPGPLFSTEYYASTHVDVPSHPLIHFVLHGIHEGRPAFPAGKINAMFDGLDVSSTWPLEDVVDRNRPVAVLYWQDGNFFFREIAEYAATYLRRMGVEAEARADISEQELDGLNVLIVAPHEFCIYGPGRDWPQRHIQRAVYLNTEQWHTSWFVLAFRFLLESRRVIDINPTSAAALSTLGLEARFLPLLPIKGSCFDHANRQPSDLLARYKAIKPLDYPEDNISRPYDVLFVGVSNPRRAKALASLATVLRQHECFLHTPVYHRPVRPGDPDMISNGDLAQIARNSKILLNIHQGESHYFEWHRLMLSGIMEGCVVVTEKCHPTGILTSGKHYLETTLEEMGALLQHLLTTSAGHSTLRRIHSNCRELREKVNERGAL